MNLDLFGTPMRIYSFAPLMLVARAYSGDFVAFLAVASAVTAVLSAAPSGAPPRRRGCESQSVQSDHHRMSITATGGAAAAPAHDHAHGHAQGPLYKLAVGAIGIVFGDIGTSPIYAFRETFAGHHTLIARPAAHLSAC